MSREPHRPGAITTFLFAMFATVGVLAVAAIIAGYAATLIHGGSVGIARYAPWVAFISLGLLLVIAPRVPAPRDTRIDLSAVAGVAVGGAGVGAVVLGRDIGDPSQIGPLQIAVAAVSVLVALASPFIARCINRCELAEAVSRFSERLWSGSSEQQDGSGPSARWGLIAAVVALGLLIAGLLFVMPQGPLGHDESVYAVKARAWYAGTPSTGFESYRPPGMPAVGWIVMHISSSDVALRVAGLVLAAGTAVVAWFTGRTMLGAGAAWIGVGVFVASEAYLRRATEFLNDLAAAGLLIATMLVIWYHFERRPGGWWLVAAAPFAAAAYYLRYGSALALAVIGAVALAIWWKDVRESWRPLAATVAVALVLLLPHVIYSIGTSGSPLGVFRSASTAVGGGGGGLADYWGLIPEDLAGRLGALVMAAGALYAIVLVAMAIRNRQWGRATRTAVFLTVPAVLITISLGVFTHGEPRFLFMPLAVMLLVGGRAITVVINKLHTIPRWIIAAGLGIIIVQAFVTGADNMQDAMDAITGRRDVIAETGEVARGEAGPDACSIRSSYVPQLTWYSACSTYHFDQVFHASDGSSYLVLFEHGKRQPEGAQLDAELAKTPGIPSAVVLDPYDRVGDGFVYDYRSTP